jgi:hypothetical protein
MTSDLSKLPPPQRKVAAKVLWEEGYTLRQIEDIVGYDHSYIADLAKLDTPEKLEGFEKRLLDIFRHTENRVAAKSLKRIEEKIPFAQIDEALDVYKAMRGKETAIISQQFNKFEVVNQDGAQIDIK